MTDAQRRFAVEVVEQLQAAGHEALWAGGCVRDLLMGHPPTDYDVATSATPEQVMALFPRTIPVGVSFGVVRVRGPRGASEVEVATFRSDDAYIDGRRPVSVTFGSAEVDATRRDFTINGMFFDPLSERVIDHVGGREDLREGVLRAIGDPHARFAEDKLRLLRAVRFAARFGFRIEDRTHAAIRAMADEVVVVAPERVAQELHKLLVHHDRALGMRLLLETGLLQPILPELVPLIGFPASAPAQPGADLWAHTLLVLERLPRQVSFPLALAALYHDVALPIGLAEGNEHARRGSEMVDDRARQLRLSNAERETAAWLVGHHRDLDGAAQLEAAVLKRRLASRHITELLSLVRADQCATIGESPDADFCHRYLHEQPDGPIDPPPVLTGADVLTQGVRPGPLIARLLNEVRDAQLGGRVSTRDEAIAWLRGRLRDADSP